MGKLNEYIAGKIPFPITRTGIGIRDWELESWKRKEKNIFYECSLCGAKIGPDDYLSTHTQRGYTVSRENGGVFEVIGFTCKECDEEISYYDTLHYG